MSGDALPGDGSTGDELRVEVLRGRPTPEELAAVLAVVTESYEAEAATAVADEPRSAWAVSTRSLRAPLSRDVPWGRFRG